MNRREDLRRLLRDADPATGADLPPADRARMRSVVLAAARGAIRPSKFPRLGVALAIATAAAALILFVPRFGHREASHVTASPIAARTTLAIPSAPATTSAPIPSAAPVIAPVLASTPRRARPPRAQARPARLDEAARVTRIVFTGPEGTRILWFVGMPDAKELGS